MDYVATKLVNGKIPAHTECPYAGQCPSAFSGACSHKGVEHSVPFSCGYARLFAIMNRPSVTA